MARLPGPLTRMVLDGIKRRLRPMGSALGGTSNLQRENSREAARRAGVVDDEEFDRRSQRRAAIFVPLLNVGGEASILYTQRTDVVSTHKGQVSFPGGHIDPGESVEVAAIRELCEELLHERDDLHAALIGAGDAAVRGDGRLRVEILGRGMTVHAVTGTLCTCVVGYLSGSIPEQQDWTR
jgi:coenzyme A diphosphatase NUDT7